MLQNRYLTICEIEASYNVNIYHQLFCLTNMEEQTYIERYAKFADRYNSLLGLTLAKALSGKGESNQVSLLHTKLGQPYLTNCEACVSISHCENTVVAALSPKRIGIDIERNVPKLESQLFLAEDEISFVQKSDDKVDILTTLWTLKEAFVKLKGTGFLLDPSQLSFYHMNDQWFLKGNTCKFYTENLSNGMKISIAADEETAIHFVRETEKRILDWLDVKINKKV